jgi:hypothetical protein
MKNQLMHVRRKVALIIAVTMLVCVISFAQTPSFRGSVARLRYEKHP